jgi:hypothetical protein
LIASSGIDRHIRQRTRCIAHRYARASLLDIAHRDGLARTENLRISRQLVRHEWPGDC